MADAPTGNIPLLQVERLEAAYNRMVKVLHGIDFLIQEGEFVALLGANGAGKSTLLKSISGMLKSEQGAVTAGRVTLLGHPVTNSSAREMVRNGVMHVMEGRFVFPDLTVEENLNMGAYSRSDAKGIREDLQRVLKYFPRLVERQQLKAGYLSGGEQQMLVIGRALMARPKLLLLDEPSMGLSPLLVTEVFRIVQEIREQEGLTILLVEQNARQALAVADRGLVMENGKIALAGSSSELSAAPDLQDLYLGGAAETPPGKPQD